MSKVVKIGKVSWDSGDIKSNLNDFMKLYEKRPIINNGGGMGAPHCFATYFLMKSLNKPFIVESGIWKGQSTWLIEKHLPKCKITVY